MHFQRYSIAYLITAIVIAISGFILSGPFYEVLVDISVSPPESVRKTDFSWITVNEWFNGQTYLIKSHAILKDVDSSIGESRLKKIISARRIGAADIIRISARSGDHIDVLVATVDSVAKVYLKLANEKMMVEPGIYSKIKPVDDKAYIEKLAAERDSLDSRIASLALDSAKQEVSMADVQPYLKRYGNLSQRITEIDREIEKENRKLEELKKVYTENWASVSELNSRISVLKGEKELVSKERDGLKHFEAESLNLAGKIASSKKELERLKSEKNSLDKKIDEMIKKLAPARQISDAEYNKYGRIGMETFIINPTTVNLLPDLWTHVVYGIITGIVIWLIAGLILMLPSRGKISLWS